jgi:hypothetical protein
MDPLEKMQPRPFKRRFFLCLDTPEILSRENTAVAASRRYFLMSLRRHKEIFPNKRGADPTAGAPPARWTSFQLAIPWQAPLQEPVSASPAIPILVDARPNSGDIFSKGLL